MPAADLVWERVKANEVLLCRQGGKWVILATHPELSCLVTP